MILKAHHIVWIVPLIVSLILLHLRHKIIAMYQRYKARRSLRYTNLDSFEQDLDNGLSSLNFDISSNIGAHDTRHGLDNNAKEVIKKIMATENISFDEARMKYTQSRFSANQIGPNGVPIDPKLVTF